MNPKLKLNEFNKIGLFQIIKWGPNFTLCPKDFS